MTTPPSPTSSDEDSIELVWQDDAGADLRSLFAKDMMSMTQQIDGWGSDESDDDEEEEDGGGEDGSETNDIDGKNNDATKVDPTSTTNATNTDKGPNHQPQTEATSTNNNEGNKPSPRKSKNRKRSIPKNLKLGQNLTPPPSSLESTAIHSAETPATISKLRRKRRRNVGFLGDVLHKNSAGSSSAGDTKQIISTSQEVDRVFDCLGLPEDTKSTLTPSDRNVRSRHLSSLASVGLLNDSVHSPVVTSSTSPRKEDISTLQSLNRSKKQRQKLKLPPLRPGKENIPNEEEEDVEDLFKEIEMGLDSFRGAATVGNKVDDVPLGGGREMPRSDKSASLLIENQPPSHHSTERPMRGIPGALKPSTGVQVNNQRLNNRSVFDAKPKSASLKTSVRHSTTGLGANVNGSLESVQDLQPAKMKMNNFTSGQGALKELPVTAPDTSGNVPRDVPNCNNKLHSASTAKQSSAAATKLSTPFPDANVHTNNINPTKSNTAKPCSMPSNLNNDDEFADDGWNDVDFAAIDQCVAMSQCKAAENSANDDEFDDGLDDDLAALDVLPAAQKPSNTSTVDDEFGDDDDEFAALDLSTATQPNLKLLNSFESTFGGVANAATVSNVPSSNTSEFSDDNFEDMDFDAIDSKIAQHQMQQAFQPSKHVPSHNRRNAEGDNALCFTRYVIKSVDENFTTSTKTIGVSLWSVDEIKSKHNDELECLRQYQENENICKVNATPSVHGYIHLRGIWYYTKCHPGDVIHLISISGQYATDTTALPVVLDSMSTTNSDEDDLVLVIHPDELITPTLISEAVQCPRLAVLQQRLGSTGLSARSAVIGTLRHDLFERCLQERTASRQAAAVFIRQIIRNNAESLVGCGIIDQKDAFTEVMKTLPQIQKFLQTYSSWDASKTRHMKLDSTVAPQEVLKGEFPSSDTLFSIRDIYSTEEMTMCPELGLKGYVDATVSAQTKPQHPNLGSQCTSLMPIELKTGHSQSLKRNHSAQLAVYTVLLRARHGTAGKNNNIGTSTSNIGAAASGMLLYLNDKSFNAIHIKPSTADTKQLIGQRNDVACDSVRASRPRGITIEYEELRGNNSESGLGVQKAIIINPPPPNALPTLNPNTSECERCYKSRECMMYASSSSDSVAQLHTGHRRLSLHFTSHLTNEDLDYFRKWDRLIDLEKHANSKDSAIKSWLIEAREKESSDGNCISSLLLDESNIMALASSKEERISLRFKRAPNETKLSLLTSAIENGNYVLLSTDSPFLAKRRGYTHKMHILKGFITHIGDQRIEVSVSKRDLIHVKRLSEACGNEELRFRLDKDEFSSGMGLLHQNLVNFLTLDIPSFSTESFGQTPSKTKTMTANTDDSRRRRRLQSCITQLHPEPRFEQLSASSLFDESNFSISTPGCDMNTLKREFDLLNCDQKDAIVKCMSANDFALIQGLPGTGKSATVSFLTRLLIAQGKRVLLTSYTHSAVDNLFCKLLESGLSSSNSIVRIGRESSCHPQVHSTLAQNIACIAEIFSPPNLANTTKTPNVNHLHNVISSAKIIGVTALTAPKSPLLSGQHFDYVIVDEAGQINQPAILGAITSADKFVLVGDHLQLPPLVRSHVAEQGGFGVSMLSHLAEGFPSSVAKLTIQYRMHEDIQSLSNIIAYKGLLKCGNDKVKRGILKLKQYPLKECPMVDSSDLSWINRFLLPSSPVVFIDTDGLGVGFEELGPINKVETTIIGRMVAALSAAGLDLTSIGIITPFRSQLRNLNENSVIAESKKQGLELGTVDVFQGRDKPAMILSFVRSNEEGKAGRLLQDFRRLNVAFSRAKQKLVMVGSFTTLYTGSDVMRPILDSIRDKCLIHRLTRLSN